MRDVHYRTAIWASIGGIVSSTFFDFSSRLVERFRRGDRAAFDDLVAYHRQRVLELIFRMTRDHEWAEEITDEVFLETYRALPTFQRRSAFSTWLRRVAINVCLQHLRKRRSASGIAEVPLHEAIGCLAENPVDMAISREQVQIIATAIDSLPEAQRLTLVLYYFKQLGCSEIAAATRVPRNTVKTRLYHGTRALRDKLRANGIAIGSRASSNGSPSPPPH
jgi:RNA polymerase sigma-70 factor (ECF subfamily)